ncbi:hypothetical protein L207DRAFT_589658 [Hyaloscypha variabilis F]|uniref:Uncharacterized protein n=1 Tax=Hyaloscypha variabilis (strain UAMH 11265 / GT02V1 / F) TaxID=1149755 RepID=A0A2J6R462_HYAVF|nr:hypothetical protein L207DRAFT_589658 [Hyaloscypha variabilis F]
MASKAASTEYSIEEDEGVTKVIDFALQKGDSFEGGREGGRERERVDIAEGSQGCCEIAIRSTLDINLLNSSPAPSPAQHWEQAPFYTENFVPPVVAGPDPSEAFLVCIVSFNLLDFISCWCGNTILDGPLRVCFVENYQRDVVDGTKGDDLKLVQKEFKGIWTSRGTRMEK